MHDDIKRFGLTGEVTSGNFVSTRESLIREVEDSMRDEGYVPLLDLTPMFTREYRPGTETFSFQLSVYGVYVGEDEAWQLAGMTNGVPLRKSTHRQK